MTDPSNLHSCPAAVHSQAKVCSFKGVHSNSVTLPILTGDLQPSDGYLSRLSHLNGTPPSCIASVPSNQVSPEARRAFSGFEIASPDSASTDNHAHPYRLAKQWHVRAESLPSIASVSSHSPTRPPSWGPQLLNSSRDWATSEQGRLHSSASLPCSMHLTRVQSIESQMIRLPSEGLFHQSSTMDPLRVVWSAPRRFTTVYSDLLQSRFDGYQKNRTVTGVCLATCAIAMVTAIFLIIKFLRRTTLEDIVNEAVDLCNLTGRTIECQRGVHNYVTFTDLGCFPHIGWDGAFLSERDRLIYKQKFCPFASSHDQSQVRRSLLFWYRTLAMACFDMTFHEGLGDLDRATHYRHNAGPMEVPASGGTVPARGKSEVRQEYSTRRCPRIEGGRERMDAIARSQKFMSMAPFSVTDIGHSCFLGNPSKMHWRMKKLKAWLHLGFNRAYKEEWLEPKQLCKTFLQLPVMFGDVGFDHRGIMWEDPSVRSVSTFYGVRYSASKSPGRKAGPQYCVDDVQHYIGDASLGRLVLRAILPSYFQHVYVENTYEILKWAAHHHAYVETSSFTPTKFASQLTWLCRAARGLLPNRGVDDFLHLHPAEKFSVDVIDRDMDSCQGYNPCYYKWDVCSPEYPCFDVVGKWCSSTVLSFEGADICGEGQVLQCNLSRSCYKPEDVNKCSCPKAICWYFVADFQKAMQALPDIPDCAPLLNRTLNKKLTN